MSAGKPRLADMTKNQESRWGEAHPLIHRLRTRRWSLRGVERERELVLLITPVLALALVLSSGAGWALGRQPAAPIETEEALPVQEAALEEAEVVELTPEEEVDPVAEAIALWGEPDLAAILAEEFPGAEWSLNGNSYAGLVWIGPGAKPSEEQLLGLWAVVGEKLAERRALAEEEAAKKAEEQRAAQERRAADPTRQALVDQIDYRAIFGNRPDYSKILSIHYPGAQWTLNGDDYSGLTWISPGAKPSKAELDALWDGVARSMALQLPLSELEARAGVSETEEFVDGALRPKGFTEETFVASIADCRAGTLPQVPPTGGGSPVGSIEIYKDPTGSQNFEQLYGTSLGELGCRIAEAHGFFGGKYSLGLGLNGDQTLMWYSDQVNDGTVRGVLEGMGALRTE